MKKKRPFFSTALLTVLGRSGGFIIPFVVAAVYGATPETDIFFFAYSILIVVISLFTHLFESTLIPFLAAEESKKNETVSRLVNTVLLWTVPCALLVSWALPEGLRFVLPLWGGWSPEAAERLAAALHEMRFFLVGAVGASAAHAVFYSLKSFWMPAVSPLVRSVFVIICICFFHGTFQIRALTWGFAAGELLRLFLTYWALKREYHWGRHWSFTMPNGKEFLSQAFPQLLALAAVNLLFVTDQWFAAGLGGGSLSLLNYADRVLQIPYLLLISAFLQIFLSDWSDTYQADPQYQFWPKIHRDIRGVFWSCAGLGAVLWVGRYPIANTLYHYSRLTPDEIRRVADLFGWLSIGFIPGVVRLLCGRVLFVMRKSMIYCLQSWLELGANIILNMILVRYYGLSGIAMATASVYSVSTVCTYLYIRRKAGTGALL